MDAFADSSEIHTELLVKTTTKRSEKELANACFNCELPLGKGLFLELIKI